LRAISRVAVVCSSTVPAITEVTRLISSMVAAIAAIASTASLVEP
jgi:hypothetical protein